MKTHENRTLLSKVLLRATTCLLLTSGIGIVLHLQLLIWQIQ